MTKEWVRGTSLTISKHNALVVMTRGVKTPTCCFTSEWVRTRTGVLWTSCHRVMLFWRWFKMKTRVFYSIDCSMIPTISILSSSLPSSLEEMRYCNCCKNLSTTATKTTIITIWIISRKSNYESKTNQLIMCRDRLYRWWHSNRWKCLPKGTIPKTSHRWRCTSMWRTTLTSTIWTLT